MQLLELCVPQPAAPSRLCGERAALPSLPFYLAKLWLHKPSPRPRPPPAPSARLSLPRGAESRCCARVLPVRSPLVTRPQPFSGWPRPHLPCRNFFAALQFPDAARLRECFGVTTVLLRQQLTLYYNSSTLTTESEILPCFSRIMHMQPRLCCQTFATSSHPYVSTGRVTGHVVCTAMLSCSNANDRRPALVTSRKVSWTFF